MLNTSVHYLKDCHLSVMYTGGPLSHRVTHMTIEVYTLNIFNTLVQIKIENLYFNHTKILPEVFNLHSGERFGKYVCCLITCTNILQLDHIPFYHVSYIVIRNLDMF